MSTYWAKIAVTPKSSLPRMLLTVVNEVEHKVLVTSVAISV